MLTEFTPTAGHVILEERDIEEKEGGLIVGRRKAYIAIKSGEGVGIPAGHEVILARYAGTTFKDGGNEFTIVDASDIKAYK